MVVLFGHTALFATLGCGVSALLEKLLIRGRECELLPAVAAR